MTREIMPTCVTLAEVEDMLAVWWADRQERYMQASKRTSEPMSNSRDLSALANLLTEHADDLGWCNYAWPDVKDLRHQAEALVTASILSTSPDIGWKILEILAKGKIHRVLRVESLFERLSRTLVHRIDALRTLISMEKERYSR